MSEFDDFMRDLYSLESMMKATGCKSIAELKRYFSQTFMCKMPNGDVVLPEEAGIGATPQRRAKAASLRSRRGLSPAATGKVAAVSVPTPLTASSAASLVQVHHLPATGLVPTPGDSGQGSRRLLRGS